MKDIMKRLNVSTTAVMIWTIGVLATSVLLSVISLIQVGNQGKVIDRERLAREDRFNLARCIQHNDQADRARAAFIKGADRVVQLALDLRQGVPLPEGTKPALENYAADSRKTALATYPYRDCSATGIRLWLAAQTDRASCKNPDGKGFCKESLSE